jgi:hypothetical protein
MSYCPGTLIISGRGRCAPRGPSCPARARPGSNALDGESGAVGVIKDIVRRDAVQVHILCGDLAFVGEPSDGLPVRQETALAVGDGNGADLAGLRAGQPGRQV